MRKQDLGYPRFGSLSRCPPPLSQTVPPPMILSILPLLFGRVFAPSRDLFCDYPYNIRLCLMLRSRDLCCLTMLSVGQCLCSTTIRITTRPTTRTSCAASTPCRACWAPAPAGRCGSPFARSVTADTCSSGVWQSGVQAVNFFIDSVTIQQ